ncbi:sensor histidine kinase [Marinicrinis lubricantis]|uniref:histidine kinase n=1 Tax=Marinicrinis lubricantis TaxID=2086470 RepID=A0ABW1IJQ2_9BACL
MKKQSLSIRSQMISFFSILIIIPLFLSAVYIFFIVQNHLKESYTRHQTQTTEALAHELIGWKKTYEDLTLRIAGDRTVQQFLKLEQGEATIESLGLRLELRDVLVNYSEYNDFIQSVIVVDPRMNMYGTAIDQKFPAYVNERISAVEQINGIPFWDKGYTDSTVIIGRQLNDNEFDLNQKIGYVFLVLDRKELHHIFQQFTIDQGQQFALYDPDGVFGISTLPTQDFPVFKDASNHPYEAYGTFDYGGASQLYYKMKMGDWVLSTWVGEGYIFQPIKKMFGAILFATVTLLIFSVIMVFYISHRITKPLIMIKKTMKQMGGGYLGLKVPVVRDDEIGQVASTLNQMSDEIIDLICQNREEESKRRRIQLQTLEYQINPHFLYNALDSVNMLARKYEDDRIGDIVTSLSRLFRIGLNQGRELITVEEETQHVSYYLKIQGIRFASQLTWELNIGPELRNEKMIKFILQPIVENSIIHGIRKRAKPGHVRIEAYESADYIVFQVYDDGVGMSAEQLEKLRAGLDREDDEEVNRGFGLRNVHQRIGLHYGPQYGLKVDSEEGQGTSVLIILPKISKTAEQFG